MKIKKHITIDIEGRNDTEIQLGLEEAMHSINCGKTKGQSTDDCGVYTFKVEVKDCARG